MASLTPGQRRVLAELKAARSYAHAPAIAREALIEAGLVESNLSTPDQAHSDRDSEGALQQRPSQGWGPASESNTTDAEQFLARAIPLARSGRYKTAGELAQAVQRSAFPGRYDQRAAEARGLMGGGAAAATGIDLTGEGPIRHRAIPGFSVDLPTSKTQTSFDQAGFEDARKRSILGQYLAKHNPGSALLRTGALSTQAPSMGDFTRTETVNGTEKFTVPGSPASGGQAPGGAASDLVARADAINAKHLPYLWGGGHGAKIADPSKATPLDCSGAVSAVLGINPRVSGQFANWGAPGAGSGNARVRVYANNEHVLMAIKGRDGQFHFFGTSHTNPGGGAGWIPQGAISKQYLSRFTVRHA